MTPPTRLDNNAGKNNAKHMNFAIHQQLSSISASAGS